MPLPCRRRSIAAVPYTWGSGAVFSHMPMPLTSTLCHHPLHTLHKRGPARQSVHMPCLSIIDQASKLPYTSSLQSQTATTTKVAPSLALTCTRYYFSILTRASPCLVPVPSKPTVQCLWVDDHETDCLSPQPTYDPCGGCRPSAKLQQRQQAV